MAKYETKCVHCGKPFDAKGGIYYKGESYCSTLHFNLANEAPMFDPRRLRPEAHAEQKRP